MPDITQGLVLDPSDRVFRITNDDGSFSYMKGSDVLKDTGKTVEQTHDSNTEG